MAVRTNIAQRDRNPVTAPIAPAMVVVGGWAVCPVGNLLGGAGLGFAAIYQAAYEQAVRETRAAEQAERHSRPGRDVPPSMN